MWKIYYRLIEKPSVVGVLVKQYKRKGYAERVAKQTFDRFNKFELYEYAVSQTNPWEDK